MKRVLLFGAVNIGVIVTLSVLGAVLGVGGYASSAGVDTSALLVFCAFWGMGGAFISLGMSRMMAKWMMGVQLVDESDPRFGAMVRKVHLLSKQAGLTVMPEVGVYESHEVNAFATGPTRNRALVAVSTGLLQRMNDREVSGVLSHEVAHIANGDMVTMTLLQGVINVFAMFIARLAAHAISSNFRDGARTAVYFVTLIGLQLALSFAGMFVVAAFSRYREYRADAGGAALGGRGDMIAALRALSGHVDLVQSEGHDAVASMKISAGRVRGLAALLTTHPPLEDRIRRLEGMAA